MSSAGHYGDMSGQSSQDENFNCTPTGRRKETVNEYAQRKLHEAAYQPVPPIPGHDTSEANADETGRAISVNDVPGHRVAAAAARGIQRLEQEDLLASEIIVNPTFAKHLREAVNWLPGDTCPVRFCGVPVTVATRQGTWVLVLSDPQHGRFVREPVDKEQSSERVSPEMK